MHTKMVTMPQYDGKKHFTLEKLIKNSSRLLNVDVHNT